MSQDTDLIKLYSGRILALAADIPLTERLAAPDATAKRRSPLCGSTVTVDITVDGDRITGFGQQVRACALGQAAASLLAAQIIGLRAAQIRQGRDQLLAMLKSDGPAPDAPFDGFDVLAPARDYTNRHASIMLAFDATLEALDTCTANAHA